MRERIHPGMYPTKEVYEQVLGDLNMIKVDTVEISGAQIITRNMKTGKEISN